MAQKRHYDITSISIPQDKHTVQMIKKFKILLVEKDISTFSEGVMYAIETYCEKHGVKIQETQIIQPIIKCEVKGCKNPATCKLRNVKEITIDLCDKHKIDYLESGKWAFQ